MNRTGLVIALGLSLVIGLLFGIFPELDLKLAALFYDAASKSFPLKAERACRVRARWRDVDRLGAGAAGADCHRGKAGAAGPADAGSGTRGGVSAGHHPALRGRADQSHLQELLGAAAAGGGDGVQRPLAVRAVVGSARRVRAQLLVLLRRGRHRVLDLRARGADAAGMAAAGLCGGDRVRGRHQSCCGWRSAGISLPTSPPPASSAFS